MKQTTSRRLNNACIVNEYRIFYANNKARVIVEVNSLVTFKALAEFFTCDVYFREFLLYLISKVAEGTLSLFFVFVQEDETTAVRVLCSAS